MRPAILITTCILAAGSFGSAVANEPQSEETGRLAAYFSKALSGNICRAEPAEGNWAKPQFHIVEIKRSYSEDKDRYVLGQFLCNLGAYNAVSVFLLLEPYGEMRLLNMAHPVTREVYEDPEERTKLKSSEIVSFDARPEVVNAEFDPASATLRSHAKWRGLGDASSAGEWQFTGGTFALRKYSIDATYDGEVNPQTVLDYSGKFK